MDVYEPPYSLQCYIRCWPGDHLCKLDSLYLNNFPLMPMFEQEHVWPWAKDVIMMHDSYQCVQYPGSIGFPTRWLIICKQNFAEHNIWRIAHTFLLTHLPPGDSTPTTTLWARQTLVERMETSATCGWNVPGSADGRVMRMTGSTANWQLEKWKRFWSIFWEAKDQFALW